MRQVANGDEFAHQGVNGVQQKVSGSSEKGEKTKIIVVGAGASGLRYLYWAKKTFWCRRIQC